MKTWTTPQYRKVLVPSSLLKAFCILTASPQLPIPKHLKQSSQVFRIQIKWNIGNKKRCSPVLSKKEGGEAKKQQGHG
jgi:hypothetical protein